ncbi:MAG: hypothetical protein M3R24_41510 [Chloroflexota bacterium]|nr:hypothetical protein [Chloroflexota bacterium]
MTFVNKLAEELVYFRERVGQIATVKGNSDMQHMVNALEDIQSRLYALESGQTQAPESPKFQFGDRVFDDDDDLGVVIGGPTTQGEYKVYFQSIAEAIWYRPETLRLVDVEKAE